MRADGPHWFWEGDYLLSRLLTRRTELQRRGLAAKINFLNHVLAVVDGHHYLIVGRAVLQLHYTARRRRHGLSVAKKRHLGCRTGAAPLDRIVPGLKLRTRNLRR